MSDVHLDAGQLAEKMPEKEVDVYVYMKKVYADLEAAGEKYAEAEHVTFTEKKASEQFDISTEEAAQIYAKAESQISRYNLYR